jgi:hypothetical protein
MILICFRLSVSNIITGLLEARPWCDFGSTATPWPPVPVISEMGATGVEVVCADARTVEATVAAYFGDLQDFVLPVLGE